MASIVESVEHRESPNLLLISAGKKSNKVLEAKKCERL